ncbi:MAG: AbrB/MazE/SpoVT family DNA-binding domain-containing protein [Rhodoglobus sp.]|nr:AbrB/MazE/SpoVT family DNA-binding domain-containing protein [Rhodoglobus sp.]
MRAFMTLSSKGQLVIPAAMRDAIGLKAGDRLDASLNDDGKTITIRRVPTLDEVVEVASALARRAGVDPLLNVDEYYQANREPRL